MFAFDANLPWEDGLFYRSELNVFIEVTTKSGTTLVNTRYVSKFVQPGGESYAVIHFANGESMRLDDAAQIAHIRSMLMKQA